jgi:hypothetical protein
MNEAMSQGAWRAASQPINFVEGDEPPIFLAAGQRDTTVDPGNTDRLAAKLRASGDTDVEVKHYPGVGHALLVGAIAGPLRGFAPVLDDTSAFIHAQMSQETPRARDDAVGARPLPASSGAQSNVYQMRRQRTKAATAPCDGQASARAAGGDADADADADANANANANANADADANANANAACPSQNNPGHND